MKRSALFLLAGSAAGLAMPAQAQQSRQITPYLEVGQVLDADLNSGEVLTYSTVAAGVDASIQTRRVQVQASYQYQRRFAWNDDIAADDIHSGLARAAIRLTPSLSVEAGAIATRTRVDMRGDAPVNLAGNVRNISQVYSAYAGPTLATRVGVATVNAAYRFGYTKLEEPSIRGIGPDQTRLDYFDSSTTHMAMASAGVKAGELLPIGLTVSGAWERDEASQLDQSYDGKYLRADAVLPVSRALAVVGGVGYEKIESKQRDPLVDGTGRPVLDGNGRFVTDPNSPLRLAYDIDGLIWDAGVIWRPSPRTMLEARVGQRYDSWTFIGSFSHQLSDRSGIQVGVYDSVDTFGRQLTGALAALPTAFNMGDDPFGNQYNGCTFGTTGGAAGGCLNSVFQSASSALYRSRGVDAVLVLNSGRVNYGLGVGYANRKFIAPIGGVGYSINGLSDEAYYAQAFAGVQLAADMGINGNLYANRYQSGLPGNSAVFGWGANGAIYRNWGRFSATGTIGIYSFDAQGDGNRLSAQALAALRYSF